MGFLDALFSFGKAEPSKTDKSCIFCFWSGYAGKICRLNAEPKTLTGTNEAVLCTGYATTPPTFDSLTFAAVQSVKVSTDLVQTATNAVQAAVTPLSGKLDDVKASTDLVKNAVDATKTAVDANKTSTDLVKASVESIGGCAASDTLRISNNTERSTTATTYTKVKETLITASGVYRIKFSFHRTPTNYAYGKIYCDAVAVGTERYTESGTYVEFSEDLFVGSNHNSQVYIRTGDPVAPAYANNFRHYADPAPVYGSGTT